MEGTFQFTLGLPAVSFALIGLIVGASTIGWLCSLSYLLNFVNLTQKIALCISCFKFSVVRYQRLEKMRASFGITMYLCTIRHSGCIWFITSGSVVFAV